MKMRSANRRVCGILSLAGAALHPAQADEVSTRLLEEITVFGDPIGAPSAPLTATEGVVTEEQIQLRPVSRVAELLEFVPGLVATQHSGEGKANQYFLRGFNLDHGTDFAVRVDGLPVNMPSHAHGQGYTDLNFLIPELVHRLEYRKGPYYADIGDFSTAGSADFSYINAFDRGEVNVTAGSEDYYRVFGGDSYELGQGELLLAGVVTRYSGPWELDQDLRKSNAVLKYHTHSERSSWSVTAAAYDNEWAATDQIPLRAVEVGRIDRFSSVDATNGGESHRYSASFDWEGLLAGGLLKINGYAIDYRLDLFSNFTYFLDNPVEGDQFEQFDQRHVYGFNALYEAGVDVFGVQNEWSVGLQTRYDDAEVGLHQTQRRVRFATERRDDVRQGSVGVHFSLGQKWRPKVRSVISSRLDSYSFDVESDLPANSGRKTATLLSPKFNLTLGPWNRTQYFLSFGRGFHSNDARGVTIRVDPATGEPASRVHPLSKARSIEVGVRSDAMANTQLAASLFSLKLDSELIYVGDAGATEALNGSERYGMEVAAVYSPLEWLTIDGDFSLTHARLVDAAGEDRIPQSVSRAASCGIVMDGPGRWSGGVRLRYLGSAPLIESNQVRSDSTLTLNLEAGYQVNASWSFKAGIYNALDSRDNDITYFYTSRLASEAPQGVEDRHFHPVEPRAFRLTIQHRFSN